MSDLFLQLCYLGRARVTLQSRLDRPALAGRTPPWGAWDECAGGRRLQKCFLVGRPKGPEGQEESCPGLRGRADPRGTEEGGVSCLSQGGGLAPGTRPPGQTGSRAERPCRHPGGELGPPTLAASLLPPSVASVPAPLTPCPWLSGSGDDGL